MVNVFRAVTVVAILALAGSSASAATIFFGEDLVPGAGVPAGGNAETARKAFLAGLVGVGSENFESFVAGTNSNGLALSFPGSSGAITATLMDPSGSSFISNNPGAGRFATSGSQFLQEVSNGFALNFSAPVAAFGFYGTDIGDFNGNVTIQLSNGGVENYVVNNTLQGPNGSLLFWGIIAGAGETFTSAAFGNTAQGTDFFGFDDLVIGDLGQVVPVPEPTSLVLLGAGLAVGLRRRKNGR